jgi:hypothetical protein
LTVITKITGIAETVVVVVADNLTDAVGATDVEDAPQDRATRIAD